MKVIKAAFLASLLLVIQHNYVCAQEAERINFESQILKILEDYHIPGAASALVSKDSIIWKTNLGLADIKNKIPVTDSTLFVTGSISKTFVSAAAMIAQEKDLLNINDPIEKLVLSLKYHNTWNQTSPVKFVHLLEHTSGFDEAHFNLFARANALTPFGEVIKMAESSFNTRWQPGKYFEYNTLGYIASAFIIEERVGISFEQFVEENLLKPLKMNSATYHPNSSTLNFSKGYEGVEVVEVPFPNIVQWPAGSMTITIGDMSHFVMMLLNSGQFNNNQLLSTESVQQMEIPETSISAIAGIQYGYGKGLWGKFERGYLFYGHAGRYGGFLSEFGYSRKLDLGYVIFINHVDGQKAIKEIKSVLLSSLDTNDHEQPLSRTSTPDLSDITGCYQPITSVPQLGEISYFIYRLIDMPIIKEEHGQLYQCTMLGDKQALLHVEDFLFKNNGEPMASSAFVADENGNWEWQTGEASYRKIPLWWGYVQFYTAVACILIVIIGFISLLFWIPVRLIRKKKEGLPLLLLPFFAICSLLGMAVSIALFYDPEKLYSLGAILFFILGWSFFIFSTFALIRFVIIFYRKVEVNSWIKYYSLVIIIACCITSSYLLYWDIINLMLWNY